MQTIQPNLSPHSELPDTGLAAEYVNEFEIRHLDSDGSDEISEMDVKREEKICISSEWVNSVSSDIPATMPASDEILINTAPLTQIPASFTHRTWIDERGPMSQGPASQMPPSPPPDCIPLYGHGQPGLFVNIPFVNPAESPPQTPPIVLSPNLQNISSSSRTSGFVDGMQYVMFQQQQQMAQQPLDLRPNHSGEPSDWDHRNEIMPPFLAEEYASNPVPMGTRRRTRSNCPSTVHPGHPSSDFNHQNRSTLFMGASPSISSSSSTSSGYSSTGSTGGQEDVSIDDDTLMTLTVRELNKRLHGCPRERVMRIKQKRRTLKNRGYAHNCRNKREHRRLELESKNRTLVAEVSQLKYQLNTLKVDLSKALHENEMLKALQRQLSLPCVINNNSNGIMNQNESGSSLTESSEHSSPEYML